MRHLDKTEIPLDINTYSKRRRLRNYTIVITCFVLLLLSFLISMNSGYTKMSPEDIIRVLFGGGNRNENLILFQYRLPRIMISIMIGMGLSVAGCLIQGVAKNPLAEPGLLGINAGASLVVILYVTLFRAESMISMISLPFLAFIGGGIAAILVYTLSYKIGEGVAPMRLVLIGIAVQSGITAITTVLVMKLDESQYAFVASWQSGSIWASSWKHVITLLPWLIICITLSIRKARVLDIFHLGDESACSLGINVGKERKILLVLSVALAASSVSVSGSIGFVGLIAPHLARKLVGPKHNILIPVSAMVGAVLVSISDTIARVIIQPSQLPTGIVVAIIGVPYFLYLIRNNK